MNPTRNTLHRLIKFFSPPVTKAHSEAYVLAKELHSVGWNTDAEHLIDVAHDEGLLTVDELAELYEAS